MKKLVPTNYFADIFYFLSTIPSLTKKEKEKEILKL